MKKIENFASPQALSRRSLVIGAGAGLAGISTAAHAQAYPARPIRIIVPYGASALDQAARILATQMSKTMGQSIVVENVPGAGGLTGTAQMVRSPKDGYTLALVNNAHATNPSLYKDMPYDSIADITAIGLAGSTTLILLVNPDVPAKDLKELVALAKSKPGQLTFGSSGVGSNPHLVGVMFASAANVSLRHIPYKVANQTFSDLIAGHIDMAVTATQSLAEQVTSGRLRAIGVTTRERSRRLPNVPTLMEAGLPDFNFRPWFALIGPSGLPAPVVARLRAELSAALAQPDVRDALARIDVIPPEPNTPESTTQFLKAQMVEQAQLVQKSGATAQ